MDKDSLKEVLFNLVERNWETLHPVPEVIPGKSYIPYAGRIFNHREVQAIMDAGMDFWLTAGERVARFEKKLAESCSKLIARHEVLRTSFEVVNDKAIQKVHEEIDFKIEFIVRIISGDLH